MYLEEIYLENTGPISKCHVGKMPFDEKGNPRPVVVVGRNGSGKSIFLSYIVDALIEFAKRPFRDIVPLVVRDTPYYRVIHPMAIQSGASYCLSLLGFKAGNRELLYCEKSGILDPTIEYLSDFKSKYTPVWTWETKGNHKTVSIDEECVEDEMKIGAHVFFPASRREDPDWLNPNSLTVRPEVPHTSGATALPSGRYRALLEKPLRVDYWAKDTDSWVLDVFLDSKVDLGRFASGISPQVQSEVQYRQILGTTIRKIEDILRTILQTDSVTLELNYRNAASSRLRLELSNGQTVPSLQSLSEGQLQLFNLFSTIIRYGEREDINRSIQLSEITGLVVIDEIDAHLHASLQHEVVPELIALFPKVQFVVSSHSPLFLLGMEKKFGAEGFWALELPTGRRITTERYSEFVNAFMYYQDTVTFEEQMKKRINDGEKPLVFTEGKTDVRYIKTALELLDKEHLLDLVDIEPVGGKGEMGDRNGGKKGLDRVKTYYELHPNILPRPLLLLYDCDANDRDERADKIWLRSISHNPENNKMQVGIENLLPESVFKERFYRSETKKDGTSVNIPDKKNICEWVCEERKNRDDFANFDSVVRILEEFVDAFQP